MKLAAAWILGFSVPWFSCVAVAQSTAKHYEVGIVYYADGDSFKALEKEQAQQGGRANYSATVKGAHASVRFKQEQSEVFRVCSVDPTRFKLFRFESKGNARSVVIAKVNLWIGGSKVVLAKSEVPVAIEASDNGCFAIRPKETLGQGEFGFSPTESMDAFMFGVGDFKGSQ